MQSSVGEVKAAVEVGVSAGSVLFGLTIGQVNEYLQAGAFIVAIISGIAATIYYIRKGRKHA